MSIDFLYDLQRDVENGKEILACPNVGRNQYAIGLALEDLKRVAHRASEHKKMAINVVRLISPLEAIAGDLFLVPTKISQPGPRGEPVIEWSAVETREAAEMMRDVRHGPSPFFGMQIIETIGSHTME
jgi:hypothetical protein